jgi:hypothetical protein
MTTYTTKHNAIRAAKKALGNDAIPTVDFYVVSEDAIGPRGTVTRTNWTWRAKSDPVPTLEPIPAAPEVADVVSLVAPVTAEQIAAHQDAAGDAKEAVFEQAAAAPAEPAKAPKVKAAAKKISPVTKSEPKAPRGPIGKTALMIEACCRKGGATPADLRAISGGTGNPWPYVIHNPKGTGWAQRFGYKFENKKVDGKQTYFLTPIKGTGKKAK